MCTYTPNGGAAVRHRADPAVGGHQGGRDERRRLDAQHRVAEIDRASGSGQLVGIPASFGSDRHRVVVSGELARAGLGESPRPRQRGARQRGDRSTISGTYTRRLCCSGLGGDPAQAGNDFAARSSFHRTTERRLSSSTMRSMPISVAFCTSHSGRSDLGTTTAERERDGGRGFDGDLVDRLDRVPGDTAGAPPTGAVGDRDRVAVASAQHSQQVMGGVVVEHGSCDVGDEEVRHGSPQHRVHEKADLIFENRPLSGGATSSPRCSAKRRSSSASASGQRSWARRS